MAQILVPVSDHSVGSWTTSPLFSKVDDNNRITKSDNKMRPHVNKGGQ